jgi:inosose dehydratase
MDEIHHHLMTWSGWLKKQNRPFVLPEVLAEVKAAGYDGFEYGGDAAELGPAPQLSKLAADHGLRLAAWSVGVPFAPWPGSIEGFRRKVDYAAELGIRTISSGGGFMAVQRRNTRTSDYRQYGETYATCAEYAARNGQTLGFHPHRGSIVETLTEIDALVRFVPDLKLCVDTGHLLAVGEDPLVVLDAHPERVIELHLKDFVPSVEEQFAELGRGSLNLGAIRGWIRRRGFRGPCVVERDNPPMPAQESARASLEAWRRAAPAARSAAA